jgi:hypothetical protein
MAKQTINIGAVANDGTGTNLRSGAIIVNDNFNEIYTALGNGSSITLTATPTELNLLSGVTALVTSTNSVALSNKTISGSNNTLLNIGNSSLTNSSFSIRDDSSSAISITLGGTLKVKSNDGITTTVSQGDTINIQLDGTVLTTTSTNTVSNKTISASSNTISGLTNTNLSGTAGITNANIANPFIQFSDESSTVNSTALGGKLEFLAGEGINTTVGASSLTISAELATSSNAGVATFNTASFTVTSGDVTIKALGVSNAQLANSSVAIGTSTLTLGAAATTSIANLNLTGTSALSGTGTIDLTGSGNRIRFNFANTGAFPNATTYQGQFAVATGVSKAYFADSGAYNELLSENSSIKDLSDVGSANPTNGQVLVFNSTSGRYEPATPASTGVTSVATGTGLTGGTITSTGTILIDTASTFQGAATIDVTNNGSGAYQFNSHYSGDNPTLYLRAGHTYALNLAVTGHPFHLQTVSGAYSAGNPYTTGLTHVATDGTVTTGASALLKVTGVLYIEVPSGSSSTIFYACQFHGAMAGKIVLGPITDTFTGDGSTTTFTINSGRNVNDILVFVNGSLMVPTTDYTVSGTTLTFGSAPSTVSIQVRYL